MLTSQQKITRPLNKILGSERLLSMPEHINDKGYKRMFSKKKNFLHFLHKYIALPWVSAITEDDLELIDKSFIDDDFRERESDIIYRVKNKDFEAVFYMILELQSTVDYTMPFRLLVYITELLKRLFNDTAKKERERKSFCLPAIIPVVFYNGVAPWPVSQSFKEYTSNGALFGNHVIDFKYTLVDLSREETQTILATNQLLDNVFILDKSSDSESLKRNLLTVIPRFSFMPPEEKKELKEYIADVLKAYFNQMQFVDDALDAFEKGDALMIENTFQRIKREERQEFFMQGKLDVARKMYRKGVSIQDIEDWTDLSKKDLEKMIKELQEAQAAPPQPQK